MRAASFLIRCVVVVAALFTAACSENIRPRAFLAPDQGSAWWTRILFEPVDREVWGIPVADLDSSWQRASAFAKSAIPSAAWRHYRDEMTEHNAAFERIDDFNSDGIPDVAVAGVFKRHDGEVGTFLLILTASAESSWRKVFLATYPRAMGFLAFSQEGRQLVVFSCLYCDGVETLEWNAEAGGYRWRDEPMDE